MLNRVTLTGRTTKDIELKYTQSGKAVGSFNLAVNRRFKRDNGEREADFINCVIWGKSAETFTNYVKKGDLVGIDGRIQTRNYQNNQGTKVYVTEVIVEDFSFLESKHSSQQNNGNYQRPNNNNWQPSPIKQNQGSFNNQTKPGASPFGNSNNVEVPDDDLPF